MTILQTIESSIIEIRGVPAILDCDVAALYEVETKRVNEALRNNSDKFPPGYVVSLSKDEWEILRSKISTSSLRSKISTLKTDGRGKHTKYVPNAFTERGLYMLATRLYRLEHCQFLCTQ